jgi:drug/metabolite transporter (DMT)-like permease
MKSNESKAFIYALICVALWSTVATAFKLGLANMQPVQLLFGGALVSAMFFACHITLRKGWSEFKTLPVNHIKLLILLGLMNPFLYYLLLFEAYDRLPAQIAQPLNYTWAIVYSLLAVVFLKQKISRFGYIGMTVSYLGVLILITRGEITDFAQFSTPGLILALASTLLWAGFWLLAVKLPYSPDIKMGACFFVGTPFIGLVSYFTGGLPELNQANLLYFTWVGIVEMGLTFLLWQKALSLTRHSARISQLIFLSPLISLFLIQNVLGEQVHVSSVTALILIIGGLLLSARTGSPKHA